MIETNYSANANGSNAPNGILVAIGGNEDKEHDLGILREIVSLIEEDPVIEVITTASEIPEESGQRYE